MVKIKKKVRSSVQEEQIQGSIEPPADDFLNRISEKEKLRLTELVMAKVDAKLQKKEKKFQELQSRVSACLKNSEKYQHL